jgi:uncharacterized protein YbjT (DUF2867 family)
MIVLTGATGTVGRRLVEALAGRDDVRAVARSAEAETALRASGVREVVRADLDDPASLEAAFTGADALFLLTPAGPQQPDQERHALTAARRAGVGRVVYQSLYDAGPPSIALRAWHEPAERWLERSDLSWAVLQPPVFSDNLLGMLDSIGQGRLVWPGATGRLSHIDARDIAAVARHALEDRTVEGLVTLSGPESLTYPEVAERLSRHLGKKVQHVDVPPGAFRDGAVGAGVPEVYADALVEAAAYFGDRPLVDTGAITRATGAPARPVDDVIRDLVVPALAIAA